MSSPSLVGGIALRAYDLPGAIIFDIAYAVLLPVFVARLIARHSRTACHFQFFAFALERVVLFSLRATVAARPHTESRGLSEYMQLTFALGFISLAHFLSLLVRTVLVKTTVSAADLDATPAPTALISSDSLWTPTWKPSRWACAPPPPSPDPAVDDPRRRFWFRRWSEGMLALYVAGLVTATVSMSLLYADDAAAAIRRNQALRFASTAIGLVLVLSVGAMLLWARRNVPRINQGAIRFLLTATALLILPAIYRLAVMRPTTPDPAAQNTPAYKATFYVVHLLPELAVAAMMGVFDVRAICGIGFKNDERCRDETPKQRAKREAKRAAKDKNVCFELTSSSKTSSETNTMA